MQTQSSAWWAALTQPAAAWRYGLDLLQSDEVTPLEDTTILGMFAADRLLEKSGQVVLDVTAPTHRTFQLSLRNYDGRYHPGPAGYPSGGAGSPLAGGLVWWGVRFRPWIDLMTGLDKYQNPVWERTYLGIFVLSYPEEQVKPAQAVIQLNLVDKSALLAKPNLVTASNIPTYTSSGASVGGYAAGSTFDSVMHDLATRGGVPTTKQLFDASTLTLPADYPIQEGSDWWTHLTTLAAAMPHVMFFDARGNLVRHPDPLSVNKPSTFTFAAGPTGIMSALNRDTDLTNTYNHVIVVGGSSTTATVRGEAQLLDVTSPYHKNVIGERVVYWGKNGLGDMSPDPLIGTAAQAQAKAQTLLAAHLGRQETFDMYARNVPPLEGYDRVTCALPAAGLNLDFLVQQVTWNLQHEGMEVKAARWVPVGS